MNETFRSMLLNTVESLKPNSTSGGLTLKMVVENSHFLSQTSEALNKAMSAVNQLLFSNQTLLNTKLVSLIPQVASDYVTMLGKPFDYLCIACFLWFVFCVASPLLMLLSY